MTYTQARAAYYRAADNVTGIKLDLQAGHITEREYKKRLSTWRRACAVLAKVKKKEGIQ